MNGAGMDSVSVMLIHLVGVGESGTSKVGGCGVSMLLIRLAALGESGMSIRGS